MPLILAPSDYEEWLSDHPDPRALMRPFPAGPMRMWPVSGTHIAAHSHSHEQIVWLLKGKLEARIGTERRVTNPGDLAVIPGGVEHEMWCHEDIEVVDIFVPPREDFLAGGGPTWLRDEKS